MISTPNAFIRQDPWRIFRIMAEFAGSLESLSTARPVVIMIGSALT